MKKIIVTGRVGKNPEQRNDNFGNNFVTFSLAVNTGSKANQKTDWLEISCNGKTAELVQTYVSKGMLLLVEGTPAAAAYINKDNKAVATLRVYANNVEFLSSKEEQQEPDNTQAGFNAPGADLKSDIPF